MTGVRTIHILRHAHSSWAIPGQRDHQRVLDERGREDAARLAQRVSETAGHIGHVVCSTAVRARQTLDLVRSAIPPAADIRFSDDLYALGAKAYEAEIRAFHGPGDLLLVGHNPTIEDLVFEFCVHESAALREARGGVGTANWLVIEREADGADGALRGTLRALIKP